MNYGTHKAEASVGPSYGSPAEAAPITELESLLNQLDQVSLYLAEDLNSLEKALAPYLRPAVPAAVDSKTTSDPEPMRSPLEHALNALLNSYRRIDRNVLELKSRL